MAKTNEESKNIKELQMLEQNLHNILFQKQAFQLELEETKSALMEIENSKDDTYKIVGQLMIKVPKMEIKKELAEKEKIIELRIKNLEKQENFFSEKLDENRKQILGK